MKSGFILVTERRAQKTNDDNDHADGFEGHQHKGERVEERVHTVL